MSQQPDLARERGLWAQGYVRVAGLDEAGRGAWAGPVVAAAVVFPPDVPGLSEDLGAVRDSKLLSPLRRERCYSLILQHALDCGVGLVSSAEIDRIGIVPATRLAMVKALDALASPPDYLLIDFVALAEISIPQFSTPKADLYHLSVSAASIIAKVTRDHWMISLSRRLPGYGMARHKGYGTRQHLAALGDLGATSQHRHSYAPVRAIDEAHRARP
ncbi:MAG TPA: ribonuclease HII [Anaerolineae bacterium]|nr:ribonuclease HII [Anaerolineae bacterium]